MAHVQELILLYCISSSGSSDSFWSLLTILQKESKYQQKIQICNGVAILFTSTFFFFGYFPNSVILCLQNMF